MIAAGLGFDLFDFDHGQFLTMADALMIAFAAFHLKSEFLLAADVLDDVGDDGSARHSGRAHGDFAVVIDQQDAVKGDRLARLNFQAFDFEGIASGDPILFASSFQYSVHKIRSQLNGVGDETKNGS
jgi:hypothetical protein